MKTEWINTKDKLPVVGVWILFYSWRGVKIGSYWKQMYKTDMGIETSPHEVTHWMPLPPPPEN